jgi:hypothetical protein
MLHKLTVLCLVLCPACAIAATTLRAGSGAIRIEVGAGSAAAGEVISIQEKGRWIPALSSPAAPLRVVTAGTSDAVQACHIDTVSQLNDGLLLQGDCGVGSFEQRVLLTSEPDVLAVLTKFTPKPGLTVRSVEDRYNFAPGRRTSDTPSSGPVDFVWSQNLKNEADGLIPMWGFKSPAVMLQQGSVFTALMPTLSDRPEPLALDLDVTSSALPWISYGAIPSQPYGHSYFRRSSTGSPKILAGTIEYQYSIVASSQPAKLGYRRVVRLLWSSIGREELLRSNNLQQDVTRPELVTFDDWSKDTWVRYANDVYRGFDCGPQRCGTLVSNRNPVGDWDKQAPDAWFNAWFQTLRTAYGWYRYGRRTDDKAIEDKAESVLNLVLTSPRDGGAFSTIYMVNDNRWLPSDGWAGFADDYHAFDMSWTAYWMLKWADDLTPGRKAEILAFVRPYGDFLVKQQLSTGVIPSWYNKGLTPRGDFRDFNAETAASALLLASLARETGDSTYLLAAEKAAAFITRDVLPRQRWFDFETFLSCARKPFAFYDPWTAQYPQNNLSQIQAAKAYLELFQVTKKPEYLQVGQQVLDYLLLTQQVWNNPAFSPELVGGFTTQNTDAEWSDAREAYAAVLLWDYYKATGNRAYLERSVAAARSTFAVAPWENWAHTGYIDEPGSLTGFHWGPGSGMTSIEIMSPTLGDAFIDLHTGNGVGFNACSLRHVKVDDRSISFDLDAAPPMRAVTIRFTGVDPDSTYRITCNGLPSAPVKGRALAETGFTTDKCASSE